MPELAWLYGSADAVVLKWEIFINVSMPELAWLYGSQVRKFIPARDDRFHAGIGMALLKPGTPDRLHAGVRTFPCLNWHGSIEAHTVHQFPVLFLFVSMPELAWLYGS